MNRQAIWRLYVNGPWHTDNSGWLGRLWTNNLQANMYRVVLGGQLYRRGFHLIVIFPWSTCLKASVKAYIDKSLAFWLSDVISIENFLSFQNTSVNDNNSIYCFLNCVNTTYRLIYSSDVGLALSLSDVISIEKIISFHTASTSGNNNIYCFLTCVKTT